MSVSTKPRHVRRQLTELWRKPLDELTAANELLKKCEEEIGERARSFGLARRNVVGRQVFEQRRSFLETLFILRKQNSLRILQLSKCLAAQQ